MISLVTIMTRTRSRSAAWPCATIEICKAMPPDGLTACTAAFFRSIVMQLNRHHKWTANGEIQLLCAVCKVASSKSMLFSGSSLNSTLFDLNPCRLLFVVKTISVADDCTCRDMHRMIATSPEYCHLHDTGPHKEFGKCDFQYLISNIMQRLKRS